MGKPKSPRPVADNEARAIARMLRVSPQKLNLVAALIRGKKVAAALADLEFSRRRISDQVRKTLQSAVANAENNHSLDVDALVVAEAFVGNSIKLKRFHARGRGKASRIERPYAHLTIIVREVASKAEAA
jgi:large subunit ribosomal protein L22